MKITIDYEACGGFDNRKPNYELVKELMDEIIELVYSQVERNGSAAYDISGEIEVLNHHKDPLVPVILLKKFHKNESVERKEIVD